MKPSFWKRLKKPRLLSRIWKHIRALFFVDQWVILIANSAKRERTSLSWADFKSILPPTDRIWADPFIWVHEGHNFIFIEEKLFSEPYGHIICLALDDQMNVIFNQVVLERPYHLSYPFVFEHDDQLYMIPETKDNHAIELYKCQQFPNQWVFEKTLIGSVDAVDATLIEKQGKWWLFANIETDGSSWDSLHLFYSDHPLSDKWTSHPQNPIVKDVHKARPAGRITSRDGNLIRPSQDCSARYGYATNFNRITILTETDYAETCEWTFKPPKKGNILATHTWNEANGIIAIDAVMRNRKF